MARRRKEHGTVVVRETGGMRNRGIIVGKSQPGRRSLGSPKRAHEMRASAHVGFAAAETRAVKKALDRGHCSAAFSSLAAAASHWGAYNAEREGAGGSGGDSRGPREKAAENAYAEQKSRFRTMCIK